MYELKRSDKLIKILNRLLKKDKVRYEATLNKIKEIMNNPSLDHYKNLSNSMKEFKRVHIDSHFVLIFKVNHSNKEIRFEDLQHHDDIYGR